MALSRSRFYPALILLATLLLCAGVYLPGISGPWMFDDYTNIIHNSYIHISSLSLANLYHAAFSLESGPLRRPISMVSFALNYYFADGLKTAPFKATNLGIHLLNILLMFWFTASVFLRVRTIPAISAKYAIQSERTAYLLAACTALIWGIHPILLTSVLYVVQRMTELAATFTLLGLICYLHGRKLMLAGRKTAGLCFVLAGIGGCGMLGVLSKENAALLPLFVILLEFFIFSNEWPWHSWTNLSSQKKTLIWILALLSVLGILFVAVNYSLAHYQNREFTMYERFLTEARVLFFYISLLFVPDINRLGHQHDDIAISSSILAPWTTLPSVLGIVLLILAGFWLRKRNPLLGLGILWFFAGHLMESTIIPLEIAHEHRNYLPSFGFALGIASILAYPALTAQRRRLMWAAFVLIVVAFAGTTYQRSGQWSNYNSFYRYEIAHHPQSARIQVGYSLLLETQGRLQEAQVAERKATILDPYEAGYVMDVLLLDVRQKRQPNPADYLEVLQRLKNGKITATTILTMNQVDGCLQTWCSTLTPHMEKWIETILQIPDAPDPGYFRYRLGRIKAIQHKYGEALNLFQQSYDADHQFLHPLFEQINIFLKLGQIDNAEFVLARLKQANAKSRYPRDQDIARIEEEINHLRKQVKQQ